MQPFPAIPSSCPDLYCRNFWASGKSRMAERRQKKRQLPHESRTFALSKPKSLTTAPINLSLYRPSNHALLACASQYIRTFERTEVWATLICRILPLLNARSACPPLVFVQIAPFLEEVLRQRTARARSAVRSSLQDKNKQGREDTWPIYQSERLQV